MLAEESKHDLKCESNPLPWKSEHLCKIGRLSVIELNLYPGAGVRGSWIRQLYHADWFVAVDFHILMIPDKDAPGSRELSANARMIWLCACVRYWPGRGLAYVCQLLLRLL